ncbi:MAG: hypothetical protein WCA10_19645 [Terracidiphilus sp.]
MLHRYAVSLAILAVCLSGQMYGQASREVSLNAVDRLKLQNVKADQVTYRGVPALRVVDTAPASVDDAGRLAIIEGTSLRDGTIEVNVAGDTAADAPAQQRGFVGIAFRVTDASHFECFYIRPKNGRSEDQLQRNHSTQYISIPGFPWDKLRSETPGKYESYVDLVPGQWTKIKIKVAGQTARLFLNGADQSALIVNDLKQPVAKGAIALWVGPGTIAHFTGLKIGP